MSDKTDEYVEMEAEYLEREAILSQKIDDQQIEIDMLRRIKRQKKDHIKSLEETLGRGMSALKEVIKGYERDLS